VCVEWELQIRIQDEALACTSKESGNQEASSSRSATSCKPRDCSNECLLLRGLQKWSRIIRCQKGRHTSQRVTRSRYNAKRPRSWLTEPLSKIREHEGVCERKGLAVRSGGRTSLKGGFGVRARVWAWVCCWMRGKHRPGCYKSRNPMGDCESVTGRPLEREASSQISPTSAKRRERRERSHNQSWRCL
jgi:hypothetical protein